MELSAFNHLVPTCQRIVKWIIKDKGPQAQTSISLLFIETPQTLRQTRLEAICLRLQRACRAEFYQNEATAFQSQKFQIQYCHLDLPGNLQTGKSDYSIYLIALDGSQLFSWVQKNCALLQQKYAHLNVIIWAQSEISQERIAEWKALFPQYRFWVVHSAEIKDLSPIHRLIEELGCVLKPQEIGYLLKGWPRAELKAKGLLRHRAFGQLANWDIETIERLLAACSQMGQAGHKNIPFCIDNLP